jgi:multimeric flavodoxin WrbA
MPPFRDKILSLIRLGIFDLSQSASLDLEGRFFIWYNPPEGLQDELYERLQIHIMRGGNMKVAAFNGSPRKDGNTAMLINYVLQELEKERIQTELVQLSSRDIRGCRACYQCFENRDQRCSVTDDFANECIEKMIGADGIVLGSPTYFSDVPAEMKALVDRAGFVSRANGNLYTNKVGLAVVVMRRSGAFHALDTLLHFLLGAEMIVPGRGIAVGRDKGDVEKDEEGVKLVKGLGQRMAWLLQKLNR